MSLARRCIERPIAVTMLFVGIVFLGAISFARLPVDLLPDIAYPRLVVYTAYPGVGPAEVERFVTMQIEAQASAVPGVQRVESVSREGLSLVTVQFAWGTNMDFAALNVREKLDNLRGSLPERADRPVLLRTDPGAEPIMAVSAAGGGDLWALKDLAESVFKRRLEQIDGVAEAAVVGGLEREIHVEVDPWRLEAHGLSIEQVAQALDAANQSAPGGTIRSGRYRYALRTLGELQSVAEIAAVPLRAAPAVPAASSAPSNRPSDGRQAPPAARALMTVGDIARVEAGSRERESVALYNGRESVGLLIFREASGNTVQVADRVEEALRQLRLDLPPVRRGLLGGGLDSLQCEVDPVAPGNHGDGVLRIARHRTARVAAATLDAVIAAIAGALGHPLPRLSADEAMELRRAGYEQRRYRLRLIACRTPGFIVIPQTVATWNERAGLQALDGVDLFGQLIHVIAPRRRSNGRRSPSCLRRIGN